MISIGQLKYHSLYNTRMLTGFNNMSHLVIIFIAKWRTVCSENLSLDHIIFLRCKHKVSAQKLFTINKAPNTLTVQLKRFDYNRCYGGKVTRHIHFPEKLNLRPYMSLKQVQQI